MSFCYFIRSAGSCGHLCMFDQVNVFLNFFVCGQRFRNIDIVPWHMVTVFCSRFITSRSQCEAIPELQGPQELDAYYLSTGFVVK